MVAVCQHSRSDYFISIAPKIGGGAWFWRVLQEKKRDRMASTHNYVEGKFVTEIADEASESDKSGKRNCATVVNGIEKHCVSKRVGSRKPELSGVSGSKRRSTEVNRG